MVESKLKSLSKSKVEVTLRLTASQLVCPGVLWDLASGHVLCRSSFDRSFCVAMLAVRSLQAALEFVVTRCCFCFQWGHQCRLLFCRIVSNFPLQALSRHYVK
jgi:hypothetical protein